MPSSPRCLPGQPGPSCRSLHIRRPAGGIGARMGSIRLRHDRLPGRYRDSGPGIAGRRPHAGVGGSGRQGDAPSGPAGQLPDRAQLAKRGPGGDPGGLPDLGVERPQPELCPPAGTRPADGVSCLDARRHAHHLQVHRRRRPGTALHSIAADGSEEFQKVRDGPGTGNRYPYNVTPDGSTLFVTGAFCW